MREHEMSRLQLEHEKKNERPKTWNGEQSVDFVPAVLQSFSAALLHLHQTMEVLLLMHQTEQETSGNMLTKLLENSILHLDIIKCRRRTWGKERSKT